MRSSFISKAMVSTMIAGSTLAVSETSEKDTQDPTTSDDTLLAPDSKSYDGDYLIWRRLSTGELKAGLPNGRGKNPRFRHKTFESADAEAKRLAVLFPTSYFIVLHEVARVKMKPVVEEGTS